MVSWGVTCLLGTSHLALDLTQVADMAINHCQWESGSLLRASVLNQFGVNIRSCSGDSVAPGQQELVPLVQACHVRMRALLAVLVHPHTEALLVWIEPKLGPQIGVRFSLFF